MIELGEEKALPTNIKVVGIGGGGNNALNHMIQSKLQGVQFVALNTDLQALRDCLAKQKLQMGKNTTEGIGTGGDPQVGKEAAEESKKEVHDILSDADMIFLSAGMGGGTGTGAIPVISQVTKDLDILTVGVITKPFIFEGKKRLRYAEQGIKELKNTVDTLIVIPNDHLLEVVDKNTSLIEAFTLADSLLKQGVQGISELITVPGLINLDLSDVKRVMLNSGFAVMGAGKASGKERTKKAAKEAVSSQLLETSMKGAKSVLLNISGSSNLSLFEVNKIAEIITENTDVDAEIIFGTVINEEFRDSIQVTVIATNFEENNKKGVNSNLIV
ncbi:MAG: cell division protein FtsZ [Clostridiales bacterium]|nr:cell division protein FtsZ [Clostridiales bacterium]MCF8023442.1 cell division protein FtsZ [Clostridiales bacterium]